MRAIPFVTKKTEVKMGVERVNSILNNSMNNKINKIEYSIGLPIKRDKTKYTEKKARQKALYLADRFKNPGGLMFYLKCSWNLTDNYIDWLVDYSFKKDDPSKYFVFVANKKMLEIA